MCRKPRDATFPSRRESAVNLAITSPPSHRHLTAISPPPHRHQGTGRQARHQARLRRSAAKGRRGRQIAFQAAGGSASGRGWRRPTSSRSSSLNWPTNYCTTARLTPPARRSHSTKQNRSRSGGLCSQSGDRASGRDHRQRLHPVLRRQGRDAGSIIQPHPARRGGDYRGFGMSVRSCDLIHQPPLAGNREGRLSYHKVQYSWRIAIESITLPLTMTTTTDWRPAVRYKIMSRPDTPPS